MSIPNNIYPNTRAEDERLVRRGQGSFSLGAIKDIDPLDIPDQAVAELINMRATPTGLSGRPGSFLWSSLELPNEFEQTGSGITFTRTGDQVTTDADFFIPEYVNYKIRTTDDRAFFINTYTDERTVTVVGKDVTGSENLSGCKIRGPINASFVDNITGDTYYLVGQTIVGRVRGEDEWKEYSVLGTNAIYSSVSSFHRIGGVIVLNNQSGIYYMNPVAESNVAIKINDELPRYKLNKSDVDAGLDASAYNYAYGYTLFKDVYNRSRYDSSVFAISETPGKIQLLDDEIDESLNPAYYPDMRNSETTTIIYNLPIECQSYSEVRIGSGITPELLKQLAEDNRNPFVTIEFEGDTYEIEIDFSLTSTYKDVASAIETAAKTQVSQNLRVKLSQVYVTSIFNDAYLKTINIYSINNDTVEFVEGTLYSEKFNLIGMLWLFNISNKNNYSTIRYLRAPSVYQPVTSYSLYRSQDIYPSTLEVSDYKDPRIKALPGLMGLVTDVPVCGIFIASLSSDSAAVFSGDVSIHEVGCTIYYTNDLVSTYSTQITGRQNNTYYDITEGSTPVAGAICYYGADILRIVSQAGNVVSVDLGPAFTSDDVGKILYYDDGSYDFIIGFDSVSESVTVTKERNFDSGPVLTDPTHRSYNDTLGDNILLKSYIEYYPYNMRFYDKMPNTNVASVGSGYLLSAVRDKQTIYYSELDEVSRMGYHHASSQVNFDINTGVKSIVNTGGYFSICTVEDTYIVNPQQSRTVTNNSLGEAFSILPSPILASSGIGSTHQSKWTEGLNAGLVAVTSEPAVRMYDGTSYSADMAEGAIKRTELQKMDSMMIVGYDHNSGIFIWGRGV